MRGRNADRLSISRLPQPVSRKKKWVIAIDGPAGSGKSTAARNVARALDYIYVDTGAMYRAVAWKALRRGVPLDAASRLSALARNIKVEFRPGSGTQRVLLDGRDVTRPLRTQDVSAAASRVAAVPGVRRTLVRRQRNMGKSGGVVMEGRDIGTAVFPGADFKFFLEASSRERARRRFREDKAKGGKDSLVSVSRAIRRRDALDAARAASPLKRAPDAVRVVTTRLTPRQTAARILARILEGRRG